MLSDEMPPSAAAAAAVAGDAIRTRQGCMDVGGLKTGALFIIKTILVELLNSFIGIILPRQSSAYWNSATASSSSSRSSTGQGRWCASCCCCR
eukprot:SAG31_NODE_2217_length_6168_cov_10.730598_5_plen_93_part_00